MEIFVGVKGAPTVKLEEENQTFRENKDKKEETACRRENIILSPLWKLRAFIYRLNYDFSTNKI